MLIFARRGQSLRGVAVFIPVPARCISLRYGGEHVNGTSIPAQAGAVQGGAVRGIQSGVRKAGFREEIAAGVVVAA